MTDTTHICRSARLAAATLIGHPARMGARLSSLVSQRRSTSDTRPGRRSALKGLVLVSALVGCGDGGAGRIGAGGVGVEITNECDLTLFTAAGDTREHALADLSNIPNPISNGQSEYVEIVTFVGYQPDRYFLADQIGLSSTPTAQEYELEEVEQRGVQLTLGAECATLTRTDDQRRTARSAPMDGRRARTR